MSIDPPQRIFLDPVQTWDPNWLIVIIQGPTGVVYLQQCGGTSTIQTATEGYLVPLDGRRIGTAGRRLDTVELTALFHLGKGCDWSIKGTTMEPGKLERLKTLVEDLVFWIETGSGDSREHMALDEARLDQLVEAWVPVKTPLGPGVLVWANCD